MADCPHCNTDLGSGFLTQADHEKRINAKNGEITALTTELTTAKTKASGYDAIVAERDRLKADLGARTQKDERLAAMDDAGLPRSLYDSVEVLFNSANAGEGDTPWGDWLKGDAKEHPLLSDKFGKPGEQQPAPKPGEQQQPRPNLNPNLTDDTQDPPKPGQKITPADVHNYIASPEYQGLSTEDQRKKLDELEARVVAQENPTPQPAA